MRPAPSRHATRPTHRAPHIQGYRHETTRETGHTSETPAAVLLAVARLGTVPEIPAEGIFLEWYQGSRMVPTMSRGYRDAILTNRLPFLIDDRPQGDGRAIYVIPKES